MGVPLEIFEVLKKFRTKGKRWKQLNIIWPFVCILLLLYSCTTSSKLFGHDSSFSGKVP